MGGLITVRVSEELQSELKKHKINWSEKIREYLEAQIKQLELAKLLKHNAARMKRSKIHADSTPMIRSDRDSR